MNDYFSSACNTSISCAGCQRDNSYRDLDADGLVAVARKPPAGLGASRASPDGRVESSRGIFVRAAVAKGHERTTCSSRMPRDVKRVEPC